MKKIQLGNLLKWILIGVIIYGCTGCSLGGTVGNHPLHSFSFDTNEDSPDAEVLDYEYGTNRQVGTYANKERVAMGQHFAYGGSAGRIPRGDFLSVKWRIKNPANPTKYIGYYGDKVDLRKRLPDDITGLRVHFVIKGPQLYVYLISRELKLATEPAGPVREYSLQKQVQIYPDQAK